jgi:hypothetical protein
VYKRKKKSRGDEPIRAIIHIYAEMSQGNSLYIAILNRNVFFCCFFYKVREQKSRTGTWGRDNNGSGEEVGKGYRRVNIV